jgi:hypothetical protein
MVVNAYVDESTIESGLTAPISALITVETVCHAYLHNIQVLYFNEGHLSVKGASVVFWLIADDIYGMHL